MKLYFTDCIEEEVLYPDPELAQGCRFQKEVPSLKSCRNQTFAKINKNLCPTLDFFHRAAIVKWLSSSKQPKKKNANFMCQLHYWLFPCLGVVAVKMKGLEWVPSFIFSRFSVSNTWLNVLAVKMIGLNEFTASDLLLIYFKHLWAESFTANHQKMSYSALGKNISQVYFLQ